MTELVPPTPVLDEVVREANEAMEHARAALESAEAEFAAAEFAAERAQLEEQMRRDRAEDERIGRLGLELPKLNAAAEFDLNQFRVSVAGLRTVGTSMTDVVRAWMQMSHTREVLRRVIGQITAHASKRSDESFKYWDRKASEWDAMLRAVLDSRPETFRTLAHDEDSDNENAEKTEAAAFRTALAKANEAITEQTQDAPIPLNRRPDDISVPGPMQIGVFTSDEIRLRNPLFRESPLPRDFSADLDSALTHAVQAEVEVFMPGVAPMPLGGVSVAEARELAAAASRELRGPVLRDGAPSLRVSDVAPAS